jgi:Saxitoxin biosynthesis operon protein SxtJ
MPKMNEKWVRDTGLIFSLIFLLWGYRGHAWALLVCALLLAALLLYPRALWPLGYLWHTVADVLGRVMNKVFFGLVFFVVVTPIGYLRRLIVGDARDLSSHPDRASAFTERGGWIQKKQVEKPY